MIGRSRVLDLVRRGATYEDIGRQLDVPPGLAYLMATGTPVDASDVPVPALPGVAAVPGRQELGNPPSVSPDHGGEVRAWVRAHVQSDPAMIAARTAGGPPGKPARGTRTGVSGRDER